MTGQSAARHRTTNWINPAANNAGPRGPADWQWTGLEKGDVTLAGLLREQGYRTIHVGKGHFGPEGSEGADPANLGFDVAIAAGAFGAPGSYYGEDNYGLGTDREDRAVPDLDEFHGTQTFLTEALTIEARKRVTDAVRAEEPFYLYFSHYAVHSPFHSDPRFAAHYTDSGKPERAQAFATLIEGMDKSLGDMLDLFDELGVARDTLVFFVGDNGSDAPLGHQHQVVCAAPLRGKKGSHYEGGVRGGFNWSSQHLVMEVFRDGSWQVSGCDSSDAWPDAVTWPALDSAARGPDPVLGDDRSWGVQRGRRNRGWGVAGCRVEMVQASWWNATYLVGSGVGALSVVRRA